MNWQLSKRIIQWLLLAVAVVFLITGLGITDYQIVEWLSFGLITKPLAHRIHTEPSLWIALVVLLVVHIVLPLVKRGKN